MSANSSSRHGNESGSAEMCNLATTIIIIFIIITTASQYRFKWHHQSTTVTQTLYKNHTSHQHNKRINHLIIEHRMTDYTHNQSQGVRRVKMSMTIHTGCQLEQHGNVWKRCVTCRGWMAYKVTWKVDQGINWIRKDRSKVLPANTSKPEKCHHLKARSHMIIWFNNVNVT